MTIRQVKRFLRSASFALRRVNQLEDQIKTLSSMREKVTPTLSLAPGGGSGNRIEDLTVRIMELEDEERRKILEYLEVYHNVQEAIESLGESNQWGVLILTRRYLEEDSWEDMVRTVPYSRRQVFRIHDDAVAVLAKKMKDGTK